MAIAAIAGSAGEALASATDALRAAGVESLRLDAELLLAEAMGVDRTTFAARPETPVPAAQAREFRALLRRRILREPIAYVLGRKGFRNLELGVDPRVLIPRPETELLVELALEVVPGTVLDVGTGSGAVALAVADELPAAQVTATDTSPAALEVARLNATGLGLAERVHFAAGSVPAGGKFDLTLANLPYVTDDEWATLQPEITRYEPRSALTAGVDGLEAFRAVVPELRSPVVALEIGVGQAPAVAGLLRAAGYARIEVRPDLAGINRVVVGRR